MATRFPKGWGLDSFGWFADFVAPGDIAVRIYFLRDEAGQPFPAQVQIDRNGKAPVHAREIRRLPIASYIQTALPLVPPAGYKGEWPNKAALDAMRKAAAPKGKPAARGLDFYRELLESEKAFKAEGLSPAQEIARRKNIDVATVYVWLSRARKYLKEE